MEIIILIISAFITSSISAVIGMGGGIILLGIMAIMIPKGYMVIALHGIIQLVSNTTRTYVFKNYLKKYILKDFMIGALVGLICSAIIVLILINFFNVNSASQIKIDFLKPVIGLFILWYLFLKPLKKKDKKSSFIKVGFISGICSIFIGATGPLIAPFFLNEKLIKENIIANKAACQMISHIGKIPIFIILFEVNYFSEYKLLLPLIAAVYIGTYFGKKILSHIPERIFTLLFKTALTLISIKLILQNYI